MTVRDSIKVIRRVVKSMLICCSLSAFVACFSFLAKDKSQTVHKGMTTVPNFVAKWLGDVRISQKSTGMINASFWDRLISVAQGIKDVKGDATLSNNTRQKKIAGIITRCAARPYKEDGSSKPSSAEYTTNKIALSHVQVSMTGVNGDYNHYRTIALNGTPDRAISILTSDVLNNLLATPYSAIQAGDLGENFYVDGMVFSDFKVGQQFQICKGKCNTENSQPAVIFQITESITPCGNLCKLRFINDDKIEPKQRIKRCTSFLEYLGKEDGFRGWYAKVLSPGLVNVGDEITMYGVSR